MYKYGTKVEEKINGTIHILSRHSKIRQKFFFSYKRSLVLILTSILYKHVISCWEHSVSELLLVKQLLFPLVLYFSTLPAHQVTHTILFSAPIGHIHEWFNQTLGFEPAGAGSRIYPPPQGVFYANQSLDHQKELLSSFFLFSK